MAEPFGAVNSKQLLGMRRHDRRSPYMVVVGASRACLSAKSTFTPPRSGTCEPAEATAPSRLCVLAVAGEHVVGPPLELCM